MGLHHSLRKQSPHRVGPCQPLAETGRGWHQGQEDGRRSQAVHPPPPLRLLHLTPCLPRSGIQLPSAPGRAAAGRMCWLGSAWARAHSSGPSVLWLNKLGARLVGCPSKAVAEGRGSKARRACPHAPDLFCLAGAWRGACMSPTRTSLAPADTNCAGPRSQASLCANMSAQRAVLNLFYVLCMRPYSCCNKWHAAHLMQAVHFFMGCTLLQGDIALHWRKCASLCARSLTRA